MSRFTTDLVLKDNGNRTFTLHDPLVYESDLLQKRITVPAGFTTDLASIPRALWIALPPVGGYDEAAVVHDLLYQRNGVTRGHADGVLKEAMEVLGVGWWTRQTIWLGVRAGGWVPWNTYRNAEPKVAV